MSDFRRPPRVKNGMDNNKLGLSAPCPTAEGKRSRLTWQVVENHPRLVVFTGDPNDAGQNTGYGKITCKLDAQIMSAVLQVLQEAIDAPGEYKVKIDSKDYTWFGGKKSDRPVVTASIIVKKDAAGVIGISVIDALKNERPKILFPITAPAFCELIQATGEKMSAGDVSKLWTKGYVRLLENMLGTILVTAYVEPPPKDQNGGNNRGGQGGGGYNRGNQGGNNQGGGNQQQSSGGGDFDNDIPF